MKYFLTLLILGITFITNVQNQENKSMTDLSYTIKGKGEPIILIHGGGTDSRMWSSIAKGLSQNFKVITYDLRGHGESPVPIEPTNHVEDLYTLLETFDLSKTTLIGHSLGGQIATDFSILHPKTVKKLIVLAPGMTGYEYDIAYQQMGQKMWKAVPDVDEMLEIMLNTPEAYAMKQSMESPFAKDIEKIHRDNIIKSLQWKNFEQSWSIAKTSERINELESSTLFIVGSQDKKDIFEIKQIYKAARQVEYIEIDGADHGLILTHVEPILKSISSFLK